MLIVVAMFGMVMAAVFSLYQTHTRSAYTEEEVTEVQQNLRIAMDRITQDIRMAGFLVPSGTNPINTFTDGTTDDITFNTTSATSVSARITSTTQNVNLAAGDNVNLTVSGLGGFEANDVNNAVVRIIGSQGSAQAVNTPFTVMAVSAGVNCGAAVFPCLTLRANAAGSGPINRGDMIARTGTTSAEAYPNTIAYSVVAGGNCPVNQSCISRTTTPGVLDILANNITNLQFSYVLDDGTEVDVPTDLSQVRAVRVTLTGATVTTTAYTGAPKTRTLVSVARLRNR